MQSSTEVEEFLKRTRWIQSVILPNSIIYMSTLVFQVIFEVVQPIFEALTKDKDIISAIAIICLVDDFHISLNQTKKNILFHCLVLKGDSQTKSCKAYNDLLENYKDMIP